MGNDHGGVGPSAGRGRDQDAGRATPAAAAETEVRVGDGQEASTPTAATVDPERSSEDNQFRAGTTAAASSAETAQEGLSLDDLEFHALRAIRYHEARGSFLDLVRRTLDFAVIALGTTAIASLFAERSAGAVALNVATALIGALQLVANLGDKAQEHRWARKKFCDLLARVTEAKLEGAVTPREMRKLTKRWTEIWGDEPTTMHVLEAVAYNATARSLNREIDPDELIEIPPWRSWTRNILAHEDFEHLTPREKREAAAKAARERAEAE